MLGTPLCPLDTSVWLSMPSILTMPCFASPAPRYMLALSTLLILAVSTLFNMLGAFICPLDASARPSDASIQVACMPMHASKMYTHACIAVAIIQLHRCDYRCIWFVLGVHVLDSTVHLTNKGMSIYAYYFHWMSLNIRRCSPWWHGRCCGNPLEYAMWAAKMMWAGSWKQ